MRSGLDKLEEMILALLLAAMTVLTFSQVVLRYVFNSGWLWSLEATTYMFAALVLFGMSYGVRTRAHIAVTLLVNRFPERTRRYVSLFAIACCLAYALLMLYGSSIFVQRLFILGNEARDVPLSKWLLTSTMPIGFLLLASRFVQSGWKILSDNSRTDDSSPL